MEVQPEPDGGATIRATRSEVGVFYTHALLVSQGAHETMEIRRARLVMEQLRPAIDAAEALQQAVKDARFDEERQ